ncbi:MAG: prepilin peptidase [Herpetosiphonaceae bacterium]|nr:prepilin peptidase [Herpetosiphonaceae bacterium]
MPKAIIITLYIVYTAVLLYVSWTDIQTRRIPNHAVIPAILLAMFAMRWTIGLPSALLGGVIAPLPLIAARFLTGANKMGMGDIKLAIFVGLILGYQLALWGVALGLVLSLLFGFLGVARGKYTLQSKLPFGPFLAAGTLPLLLFLHLPL